MDPRAAFPIMMGSGALLLTLVCSVRILRTWPAVEPGACPRHGPGRHSGGCRWPRSCVKSGLPIEQLRWGVVAVVTYAGAVMLRAALARPPQATAREAGRDLDPVPPRANAIKPASGLPLRLQGLVEEGRIFGQASARMARLPSAVPPAWASSAGGTTVPGGQRLTEAGVAGIVIGQVLVRGSGTGPCRAWRSSRSPMAAERPEPILPAGATSSTGPLIRSTGITASGGALARLR